MTSPVRFGSRFVVKTPLSIRGLTHWRAPFTGGFECTVAPGTVVVVAHEPTPGATAVGVRPEAYAELEPQLVPQEDRTSEKYDGYSLVIPLEEFGRSLEPD